MKNHTNGKNIANGVITIGSQFNLKNFRSYKARSSRLLKDIRSVFAISGQAKICN